MVQNKIVANATELISDVLKKDDTIYNQETSIEYRVNKEYTTGSETLLAMTAAGTAVIETSTVDASDTADNAVLATAQSYSEAYVLTAEFGAAFPTADTNVAGEVWSNAGVLTVSAG